MKKLILITTVLLISISNYGQNYKIKFDTIPDLQVFVRNLEYKQTLLENSIGSFNQIRADGRSFIVAGLIFQTIGSISILGYAQQEDLTDKSALNAGSLFMVIGSGFMIGGTITFNLADTRLKKYKYRWNNFN